MLTVTMADSMKKSVISQAIVVDDILARGLRFQKLSMWVDHSLTVRLVVFSAIISQVHRRIELTAIPVLMIAIALLLCGEMRDHAFKLPFAVRPALLVFDYRFH